MRTTCHVLRLGEDLALTEAEPAVALLDPVRPMMRGGTITSAPTCSFIVHPAPTLPTVLDSGRRRGIATPQGAHLHRCGLHWTDDPAITATDDRTDTAVASSSAVTDHRNDLAEHLTITQDQHVKVQVSGSLLPGCYRASVGRSGSDGGWSQGPICSKNEASETALSHQNPAYTSEPRRSPMPCLTCDYAHQHASWPPGFRGTHCADCHRSWTSRKEAHCAVCHAQFASATAADQHWCDGKGAHTPWCDGAHGRPWSPRHADPADVPTLVQEAGVWRLAPAQTPQNVPANGTGSGSVQAPLVAS